MDSFNNALKQHIADHQPNLGNSDSVLALQSKAYSEFHRLDNKRIRADFNELYRQINRITLLEMNQIIDPLCKFYRNPACPGIRMNSMASIDPQLFIHHIF